MTNENRGPIAEEGTYQGKPSLTLKWRANSEYPFSFGTTKARLILACIDEIKAFVERHPEEGIGNRGRGRPAAQRQPAQTMNETPPAAGAQAQGAKPAPANDDNPPC